MIISKEIRELIETQMALYKERIIDEEFLEAGWCLSRLTKMTENLRQLKNELKKD